MTSESKGSDDAGMPVMGTMLRSKLYRDYRKAFMKATGLPLELHAVDEMKVYRPLAEFVKVSIEAHRQFHRNISLEVTNAISSMVRDERT